MSKKENTTAFIPAVSAILPETDEDFYFLFCKDELLVKSEDNCAVIPCRKDLQNLQLNKIQYLGSIDGKNCFCGELNNDAIIPNIMYLKKFRDLAHRLCE